MWAPLVLVCGKMACFIVGGPLVQDEDQCKRVIVEMMVPYIRQQSPSDLVTDLRCIQWDEAS